MAFCLARIDVEGGDDGKWKKKRRINRIEGRSEKRDKPGRSNAASR